jgi:hypothetical protein
MKRIIVEVTKEQKEKFENRLKQNGKNMADAIRAFIRVYNTGKLNIVTEDRIEVIGE